MICWFINTLFVASGLFVTIHRALNWDFLLLHSSSNLESLELHDFTKCSDIKDGGDKIGTVKTHHHGLKPIYNIIVYPSSHLTRGDHLHKILTSR